MKKTKIEITRIEYDNYIFEIENVNGLKTIWLHNKDYGIKEHIIGMQCTMKFAEDYIKRNYMELIENYKDMVEDDEDIPLF